MSELYSFASGQIYDRTAKTTKQFFAKVQNKMHYELIYERADADKPHMGLTTWAAAPEMRSLERIVCISGFGRRSCRAPYPYDNGRLGEAT